MLKFLISLLTVPLLLVAIVFFGTFLVLGKCFEKKAVEQDTYREVDDFSACVM